MSPYFVVTSRVLYDSQWDNISLGAQSQPTSAHTRCERYLEKQFKKNIQSQPQPRHDVKEGTILSDQVSLCQKALKIHTSNHSLSPLYS